MNEIKIENRRVGAGSPVLVVAEIGVNHDGSWQKAVELVRVAANCGADAVKLQLFRAASLLHPSAGFADYQKGGRNDTPIDMLRQYELNLDALRRVVQTIRDLKMIPLATPFSPVDIETARQLRLPALKIASPDIVNRPLLDAARQMEKPLLVSTGAATVDEISQTVGWLKGWQAPFSLLHCVSAYPVPAAQANLCWINELARRFDAPIGYSDHTTEISSGGFAVAAGAVVIEKHLTYDRSAKGPDHATSADPAQFGRYVKAIREAETLRGSGEKHVLEIEEDVRKVSRQSLVLRKNVEAGAVLKEDDLTVQRPGTGLPAAQYASAIGRKAARALTAGAMLSWDMLSDAA